MANEPLVNPARRDLFSVILPQVLPNVEATIIDGDAEIVSIVLSNHGGQATPKFTLKDKQASPKVFVFGANTPVPVGASVAYESDKGKFAKGGLTWVADTADAITGTIDFRRP